MAQLRFANEREEKATRFLEQNKVQISSSGVDSDNTLKLEGTLQSSNKTYEPKVAIDRDERIVHAECTCNWHQQNKLFKGPCEHILALRMHHARSLVRV